MNSEAWVKYPEERKLVGKDWTLDLIEGDSITGVPTVSVSDGSTVVCTFAENEGDISKFWLTGGLTTEIIPEVHLEIDTDLGETLKDVIQVKVLKY